MMADTRAMVDTNTLAPDRHRHLLNDLASLMPHGRKDAKFDSKTRLYELNELCEMYNCNNIIFGEARKGKDLYLHFAKPPNGPTIKFHVQNSTSCLPPPPRSVARRIVVMSARPNKHAESKIS